VPESTVSRENFGQMKQLSACAEQESLDFSVQSDVRAAKVADGLLRIANNEQLSWHRIGGPPTCDRDR